MIRLYLYIYYFLKVIGICPFKLDSKNCLKFSVLGATYIITLIIIYTYAFTKALKHRSELITYTETPLAVILDTFSIIFEYLTIVISWLIFVSRSKTLLKLFDFFEKLRTLEKNFLTSRSKKYLDQAVFQAGKNYVISNVLFVICITTHLLIFNSCEDLRRQVLFWFFYNIPIIVIVNVALIMIGLMDFSCKCYKILNTTATTLLSYEPENQKIVIEEVKLYQ